MILTFLETLSLVDDRTSAESCKKGNRPGKHFKFDARLTDHTKCLVRVAQKVVRHFQMGQKRDFKRADAGTNLESIVQPGRLRSNVLRRSPHRHRDSR